MVRGVITQYLISVGVLIVKGNVCYLKDMEGKDISKTASYSRTAIAGFKTGGNITIGGNELEV
jgi:hypothetical protein